MNILSATFWASLTGALVICFLKKEQRTTIKMVALVTSVICLGLSLSAYFGYDQSAGGGFQYVLKQPWIPEMGISFHVGANGISLPLVLLTGFIMFTGVLIAWNVDDRTKEFFILFLILVAGVFGVFVSLDLFLLFIFYELAVLPMYLLIGNWGSVRKEYGAMKLTLYLMAGSAVLFLGMLALYVESGIHSFDLIELARVQFPRNFQILVFPLVFVGFGVLAGLWPLHTWSPVGHVAAPTSVSMLHAGVLMKLGAYGCFRVAIVLFPEGGQFWLPWIAILATVNIVYGSMVAMVQRNFKYVIGYSSVSHMGFVILGLASMNEVGVSGAVLQMFSHGIMTALFFAIVGRMIYDRTHTLEMDELGGLSGKLPFANVCFIIGGFASMGLPGLSGFVAELQILIGTWRAYPILAALCGIGIVVTAAYVLRVLHKVFYGEPSDKVLHLAPITGFEKVAGVVLVSLLIIIGLYPSIMVDLIQSSVNPIVSNLFPPGSSLRAGM